MKIQEKIKALFSDMPSETVDDISMIIPDHHRDSGYKIADGVVENEVIYASDSSYLVSKAARMCIGQDVEEDYEKRLLHISRVALRGHESTFEHTNIIIMLHFNHSLFPEFINLASGMRYLNWKVRQDTNNVHILIGGTIRAYKNAIRFCPDCIHNPFINSIKEVLYSCTESVYYDDLIKDGVMNRDQFATAVENMKTIKYSRASIDDDVLCDVIGYEHKKLESENVEILATEHHTMDKILKKVSPYGFSIYDCMDMAAVTVVFKNISRAISVQIVRHRNGISQMSQRYVDYRNKGFVDPLKFISDEAPNKRYNVNIYGSNVSKTSLELGNDLCKIYDQLIEQGMKRQDARGFLPSNVVTDLIMTFTYRNLYHFFAMREANDAQNEVRDIANQLHRLFREYEPLIKESDKFDELMLRFADLPLYLLEQEDYTEPSIDEEEVVDGTIIE